MTNLDIFINLLLKWQKTINLISNSTKDDILIRHVKDSLQLVDYLPKNAVVFDLGSGGGFPGIILGLENYKVYCVESDIRKSLFLKEVKRECNLKKLEIINDRLENIVNKNGIISREIKNNNVYITARGFASIKKILDMTNCLDVEYVLLKGVNVNKELEEALKVYNFEYNSYKSKISDGFIVVIKNVCLK